MRRLVPVLLFVLLCGVSLISAQDSLRVWLSDPACPASCFLGIIPGQTSRDQLEQILNSRSIAFDAQPLGLEGKTISYLFDPKLPTSLINRQDSVEALVGVDVVEQIGIPLSGVTTADVVKEYGAPTVVVSGTLTYVSDGLAFQVSNSNQNMVELVFLRTPGVNGGIAYFMEGDACHNSGGVCSIATATPSAPAINHFCTIDMHQEESCFNWITSLLRWVILTQR